MANDDDDMLFHSFLYLSFDVGFNSMVLWVSYVTFCSSTEYSIVCMWNSTIIMSIKTSGLISCGEHLHHSHMSPSA
jgi:hypothetical protein